MRQRRRRGASCASFAAVVADDAHNKTFPQRVCGATELDSGALSAVKLGLGQIEKQPSIAAAAAVAAAAAAATTTTASKRASTTHTQTHTQITKGTCRSRSRRG